MKLLSQAACSYKQGNNGRLKAFLLTVSNYSQLLQRSALTNYCIDFLADKVHWIKHKSLQCYISQIPSRKRALVLSDYSDQPPDTHLPSGVVSTTCCHCDINWCACDVILCDSSFKLSALHPFMFMMSSSATHSFNHLTFIHSCL